MENDFEVNLIVGSVKNDHCVKVSMPTTYKDLKKRLKIISAKKKDDYKILHSDFDDLCINIDTVIDNETGTETDVDIFEINEKLNTLKGLGKTMEEISAVVEAFRHWDWCDTLDDIIKIITTRDYEFYDVFDDEELEEFIEIYKDDIVYNLENDILTDAVKGSYLAKTGIIVRND